MDNWKGTKGEWSKGYVFRNSKTDEIILINIQDEDNNIIAEAKGIFLGVNNQICLANAMLISATPDLLEALQTIVRYWNTPQKGSLNDHVTHSLNIAEKAINKALGL